MRPNPPFVRTFLLLFVVLLPGFPHSAAQPADEAQARRVLQDALRAHGGPQAVVRSRALEITGLMRNRGPGGVFSELPFTAVLGQRGSMRAELQTPSGLTRLVVSDGRRTWIAEGVQGRVLQRGSAMPLVPYNPLSGLFQALTDGGLGQLGVVPSEAEPPRVRVLLTNVREEVPERLYEIAFDPQTELVSSLTRFAVDRSPAVREPDPELVYGYSDYREVEGMMLPFHVRMVQRNDQLLSEMILESATSTGQGPDTTPPSAPAAQDAEGVEASARLANAGRTGSGDAPAIRAQVMAEGRTSFVDSENQTGVAPFGSFDGVRENVDLNNLNLNLIIPLFTLKGRNGMDFNVSAVYNAVEREWVQRVLDGMSPGCQGGGMEFGCSWDRISNGGSDRVQIQIEPTLVYETGLDESEGIDVNASRSNRWVMREPDGTRHEFRNASIEEDFLTPGEFNAAERMRSTGAGFATLQELGGDPFSQSVPADVFFRDGTSLRFSGGRQIERVEDRNGNRISFERFGTSLFATDTLGREIVQRPVLDFLGRIVGSEVFWRSSSNQAVSYILREGFPSSGQDTLELPNGLEYVFTYATVATVFDGCGFMTTANVNRLVRIDYPWGGSVSYDWGTFPSAPEPTRVVLAGVRRCPKVGSGCTASEESTRSYFKPDAGPTQVTLADGASSEHTFTTVGNRMGQERETLGRFFDTDGTLLRTVQNVWGDFQRNPMVTETTETLHVVGGADQVRRSSFEYDLNGYEVRTRNGTFLGNTTTGNVVRMEDADWGDNAPGPALRITERSYLDSFPYDIQNEHILDRVRVETVRGPDLPGGEDGPATPNLVARTENVYDDYAGALSLIDIANLEQHNGQRTSFTARGNVSRTTAGVPGDVQVTGTFRYDVAGNVRESTNPRGFTTFTLFQESTEYAFPSQVTDAAGLADSLAYDFLETSSGQGRGLGLLTSHTGPNGRTTSFAYDFLGRLKQTDFPDGGRQILYYSDTESGATHHQSGQPVFPEGTELPLRSKTYKRITDFPFREQEVFLVLDGLGRQDLRGVRNGPSMDWAAAGYDRNERQSLSTMPLTLFYDGNVPVQRPPNSTTTAFDGLSRAVSVTTPDGQSATTVYRGPESTTTDQAGASRRTTSDGLGRVATVREPDPVSGSLDAGDWTETRYAYDAAGRLLQVRQGFTSTDADGSGGAIQQRSFDYDSLGRLLAESHPESGITVFSYDANGNLITRTDERGKRSTFSYDAIDRLTSVQYSDLSGGRQDTTPSVFYTWDGSSSANQQGRLRQVSDGVGLSRFEYDARGRISRSERTTSGITLTGLYGHDFAGGYTSAQFSGVNPATTFFYSYDEQGRQKSLTDSSGNVIVSDFAMDYSEDGAERSTFFGNGLEERITFNQRLQPEDRQLLNGAQALMDLRYGFIDLFDGANNGNVMKVENFLDPDRNRLYFYDKLNRLEESLGLPWGITYTYDRFGNRLSAQGTMSTPNFQSLSLTVDPATNRIVDSGYQYDAAGYLVADPQRGYRWDAAGRLIGVAPSGGGPLDDGRCSGPGCPPPPDPPSEPEGPLDNGRSLRTRGAAGGTAASVSYEYDYGGRRVIKRHEDGSGRIYFWDEVIGEVLWEFPLGGNQQDLVRGYFNGKLVVENDTRGPGIHFFHRDHLGSTLLTTDFLTPTVVCDSYFHPFGQSADTTSCDPHVRKFTGKERDPESDLDYFGARYYDPVAGRFQSVDPASDSAIPRDPQTWNRYAYVTNNPLVYVDPTGERRGFTSGDRFFAHLKETGDIEESQALAQQQAEAEIEGVKVGVALVAINVPDPTDAFLIAVGSKLLNFGKTLKVGKRIFSAFRKAKKRRVLRRNEKAGEKFENEVVDDLRQTEKTVAPQITVKTDNGVRTRLDAVTESPTGTLRCIECKSSSTAPLTPNQKAAFPEIERSGATVVGQGKPGVPGGTRIPPTRIEVIRPPR